MIAKRNNNFNFVGVIYILWKLYVVDPLENCMQLEITMFENNFSMLNIYLKLHIIVPKEKCIRFVSYCGINSID